MSALQQPAEEAEDAEEKEDVEDAVNTEDAVNAEEEEPQLIPDLAADHQTAGAQDRRRQACPATLAEAAPSWMPKPRYGRASR